jgi:cell division protease FtsH
VAPPRGYTIQRPTEDRFLLAASDLRNRIAVLLGGRAAEQALFDGDVSTGAADDLQRATEIALEMVTRHGMDATVGQRTYALPQQTFLPGAPGGGIQAAEATTREIDVAVRDIIARAFERAVDIPNARRADLDRGAEMLLTRETLSADDFSAIRPAAAKDRDRILFGGCCSGRQNEPEHSSAPDAG